MRLTGLTWGNLSSVLSTLEENEYVNIEKTVHPEEVAYHGQTD